MQYSETCQHRDHWSLLIISFVLYYHLSVVKMFGICTVRLDSCHLHLPFEYKLWFELRGWIKYEHHFSSYCN